MKFLKALSVILFMATPALAQETRTTFGRWTVVCEDDSCIAILAVRASENDRVWSKIVMSVDEHGRPELQIRTPPLKSESARDVGYATGFDGKAYGRGFFDSCDANSCEGSLLIDGDLKEMMTTRKRMFVMYSTSNSEGEVLDFSLDGTLQALEMVTRK